MTSGFAASALLLISTLLGVPSVPSNTGLWQLENKFTNQGDGSFQLTASSTGIVEACKGSPSSFVHFPFIVHGGHRVLLDGTIIAERGNVISSHGQGYYVSLDVPCARIMNGAKLEWHAITFVEYFTRINEFPQVKSGAPWFAFFAQAVTLGVGFSLLLLSLLSLIIFRGKVTDSLVKSMVSSNLFFAAYVLLSSVDVLPVSLSVLTVHKLGVSGLWIGAYALLAGFVEEKIITQKLFRFYQIAFFFGLVVMLFAANGDEAQLGIHLIFPISLGILTATFLRGAMGKKLGDGKIVNKFEFLSLGAFSLFGANDILFNLGVLDSMPIFPLGILAGQFLFILAVDRRILDTYKERDFLRQNLEQEVARKTAELTQAQAELVQSAKLASLGTLSAGLAHEINNSINYVNGALVPLEKLVEKSIDEGTERAKIQKLFHVMKDGLNLTVDIIRSLRNFSGINQAKFNDVEIRQVVDSVIAILRNKLRDKIEVTINIPSEMQIHGSVVGLNQVFMNLISNAVDAMENGGKLTIEGKDCGDSIQVQVADSGTGIPSEILDRVFDPFFTTKEVGKGTGLGLHIVRKEIERHKGKIAVDSQVGRGTVFLLTLPKNQSVAQAA